MPVKKRAQNRRNLPRPSHRSRTLVGEPLETRQLLAANLLSNGDFSSGNLSGWSAWGNDSIVRVGSASPSGPGFSGSALDISATAGSNIYSRALVYSGLTLQNNTEHTLSFDIVADSNRDIRVRLEEVGGTRFINNTFSLNQSGTQKSFTFNTDGDTASRNVRIVFYYGGSSADFLLDNVSVSSSNASQSTNGGDEEVQNGDFSGGDISAWSTWGGDSFARVGQPNPAGPNFSGNSLRVNATSGNDLWSRALLNDEIRLSNNTDYTFSFDAVAQGNRPLRIRVERTNSSERLVDEALTVGSGGTGRSFDFTTPGGIAGQDFRILMYYGGDGDDFWLDNISIRSGSTSNENDNTGNGNDDPGNSEGNNLISNGDFSSNLNGWSQWNNGNLNASHARDANHSSAGFSGGSLRVAINGAASSNFWDAAAVTSATLKNNTSYTLSFNADANGNRPLRVQVKRGSNTYTDVPLNLNSSGTSHTITFSTNGTAAGGSTNVIFFYGDSNANFWIDSVSLVAGGNISTEPVGEGHEMPVPSLGGSVVESVDFESNGNGDYSFADQQADWQDFKSSSTGFNARTTIQSTGARPGGTGNKVLKITYANDTDGVYNSPNWTDLDRSTPAGSNATAEFLLPDRDDYYLSYWVRFDPNFGFNGKQSDGGPGSDGLNVDGKHGGKLPGLGSQGEANGSGRLCSGGDTCDGTNGFTSRYMWRYDGRAVMYLYHMGKPGQFGEDIQLKHSDGSDVYFPRGEWINLVQRVKLNSTGQSNGLVEVWMNGEKVLSRGGLQFVNNPNTSSIDTLSFATFHGGGDDGWLPRQTTQAFFDDFVVTSDRSDVGIS
ncbi:MAG: carbohydrate binding domain-containing protein [Planctomycetota bacterium]